MNISFGNSSDKLTIAACNAFDITYLGDCFGSKRSLVRIQSRRPSKLTEIIKEFLKIRPLILVLRLAVLCRFMQSLYASIRDPFGEMVI